MKIIKYLFALLLIVSLASCNSDDDSDTPYLLTSENFAGIYNFTFLFANNETTIEIGGVPQTIPSTSEGSVFEVEAIFNQNGTFSIVGQFLLTTTITGSDPDEDIILLDENGTFQLNDSTKTIIISGAQELLNGTFNVTLFTENEIRMTKEETIVDGNITTDLVIELRFVKN